VKAVSLRAVTFDVYAALFDTVEGLRRVLAAYTLRRGIAADPAALARTWRAKHAEYLLVATALDREPARNRPAILAALHYTLRPWPPPPAPHEVDELLGAWEALPPWPETVDVLRAVRALPLRLGALSNGDADMLRALLQTLPMPFDVIVSTEGGRFKPHPSVYARALSAMGVAAEELLHVAGSATDAMGATAAGIRTVWVNRAGDAVLDPRWAPADEAPDLQGLPGLLRGLLDRA